MPIRRLLHEGAFDQDDIDRMTTAYEAALKLLRLVDRNDPVTEIVTDVAVVTVPVVITKLLTSVDAGMVTNAGTDATAGLLLVTRSS